MDLTGTYFLYLIISIAITIWVAHVLHSRGRIFLVEIFHSNEGFADSINDLLVVGFYLVNLGYVTLALKYGRKPQDFDESIEFLATKVGSVLLILGAMHFFNLFVFSRLIGPRYRERDYHRRGTIPSDDLIHSQGKE